MSIVEAFSTGTPVICPDWGNAGNIVTEGVSGYKFPRNSYEGIIASINKLKKKFIKVHYRNFMKIYIREKLRNSQ